MIQPKARIFVLLILSLLLAGLMACAGPSATDSGAPQPIPYLGGTTAAGTATEVTATAPGATESAATETDANGIPVGFTAEGRPYRGRLDAPVTMDCLLYTSPSPRDRTRSRMPSSA